jgi:hypothetical protein
VERTVSILVFSLLVGPLVGAAASFLMLRWSGKDAANIARGYLGLVVGLVAGSASVVLIYLVTSAAAGPGTVRSIQVAAVALAGLYSGAYSYFLLHRYKLNYADRTPVIEVEARVPRIVFGENEVIDEVVGFDFVGGDHVAHPKPADVRRQGDGLILPWEATLRSLKSWTLRVYYRDQFVDHTLALPARPRSTTLWSGWEKLPGDGVPNGFAIRYRFRLDR